MGTWLGRARIWSCAPAILGIALAAGCLTDERPDPTSGPVDDDEDGFTAADGDCDDRDPGIFPGAPERCDGVDEDCDGVVDDHPVDPLPWWSDADGDGYGDRLAPVFACSRPPGAVADNRDCDDGGADVNPGAAEVCNGRDDDCDRLIDDADPDAQYDSAHTWAPDSDGDGWGDASVVPVFSCSQPPAHVADRSDCDDGRADVSPDGTEVCGGLDDDCDGLVDDADPSRDLAGADWWYADEDGDGFGAGDPIQACSQPVRFAGVDGDCDDTSGLTWPGAPELCDGLDNGCDGGNDDGTASFQGWDGWVDITSDLASGTVDAPAAVRFDEPGTLHICPGVWHVNLTLAADIGVLGAAERERVVLSGSDRGRVITVEGDDRVVDITGVTLEGGAADDGAALWMEGGELTVRESLIWFNEAESNGGAVWRAGGSTTLSDSELRACVAGGRGGAVYLSGGSLLATGVSLTGHAAGTSGGAMHAEGTEILFALTDVSGNRAGTDGGGLALRDAPATFDEVSIVDNLASDGSGGGLHVSGVELALDQARLEGNLAHGSGGALWASGGEVELDEVVFTDNDAALGDGGAAVFVALTARLDEVTLSANTARTRGGGVLLDDAVLEGEDLSWSDNLPTDLHVLPLDLGFAGTESLSCDGDGCR
ncbi:MAG: hypothetical protein ACI8PZ_005227 [Myxococcota bacterium]|jgi:hypothetical protein